MLFRDRPYKPNEPIGPIPVTFRAEKITEPLFTAEMNFVSKEMKGAYLFSEIP